MPLEGEALLSKELATVSTAVAASWLETKPPRKQENLKASGM